MGSAEQLNAKNVSPDIVMLYYLMENLFIELLKMLHLPVYVTYLTKIQNLQGNNVC